MSQLPGERADGWASSKIPSNGYGISHEANFQNAFHPSYDYLKTESSPAQSGRDNPSPLTTLQTIDVFRNAVDIARELVHKQGASEDIDTAVQPNLTLDLKRKGIRSLPDEVIQIIQRDVERIVLSHNYMSTLPIRFYECATMQYLNLRGNKFIEFPQPLLRMEKLQILDLSRNDIDVLPEEIKNMKSLRVLSVMHNHLSDLPLSLGSLESLRILKMTGNPLNEFLKAIVDSSESATSPLTTPIAENEKEALLTVKIKQYLRNELTASESGGESSGESPLETPKPLKRNTSIRFPVVPAIASESASDSRTPSVSKPSIPHRSHHRIVSGHNSSNHGGSYRRPNVSPLTLGNERNRSNSENVLQGTQNTRNKRMGIVPRKAGLSPLAESTNRNSLHFRGTSHGSVLRDRHGQGAIQPSSAYAAEITDYLQQPGTFIRQLSSVPEQKSLNVPADKTVEGAKGLLFSLHSLHPYIISLLPLACDEGSKRSSLERVFYNSSTHLDSLDHELYMYESTSFQDDRHHRRALHTIRHACQACIVAYIQVGKLLVKNARQILTKGDQRYIRMLLLLMNGSSIEASNALVNFGNCHAPHRKQARTKTRRALSRDEVPKLTVRPMTPIQDKTARSRRFHSETVSSTRYDQASSSGSKPAAYQQSAVPLYINGRSRSNSRSHGFSIPTNGSLLNTPGSNESFLSPGVPLGPGMNSAQFDQNDAAFEKVHQSLQILVNQASEALPITCSLFSRGLEAAQTKSDRRTYVELWNRLLTHSRQTLDLCENLSAEMSSLKLQEFDIGNPVEFWSKVTRFTNGFVNLCDEVKSATATNREQIAPLNISRLLKPVHKCVRVAIQNLKESPWAFVLTNSTNNSQTGYPTRWQLNGHLTGVVYPQNSGHHRTRGDSGSSSSPFMPATPLSAALGPAAQATMPISSSGLTGLNRIFQGNVFQRADFALTMQHPMALQRRT